jgi:hypothetical protein
MHTIGTFANRVVLMECGRHTCFEDVSEGIRAYRTLFIEAPDMDIQRVCNGNEKIRFPDVSIPKRELAPGESFSISIRYEASVRYPDAEIDLGIISGAEVGLYFQATNKAYQREITLEKGLHEIRIEIKSIPMADALGTLGVTLWSKGRTELLFWWRIPLRFTGVPHSTGRNFLDVEYSQDGG